MNILSINIRATQGGAGRVGYDLHHRFTARGHGSRLLYGYGSGIRPDGRCSNEPDVEMLGSRPVILANFAAHLFMGREVLTASRGRLARSIAAADVVQLHAPHHWYLRWADLIAMLGDAEKPVVITAHDWWLLTGRCGFTRDCEGWHRQCGECGARRFEDLPAVFDRSRAVRRDRQRALRTLGDRLTIVCPSRHLAEDHRRIYPELRVAFIANALDREYDRAITTAPVSADRTSLVFCASDLDSPGKIDPVLVRTLAAERGRDVSLIGRGTSLVDLPVTHHGEVRDRATLAGLFASARTLIFPSQMDNAPLTIIEALAAGTYVVAYPSRAAQEMLELVGGRCAASPEEALDIVRNGREADLFGNIGHAELARRASETWSGARMTDAYLALYQTMIDVHRQTR